jgi:hypothetical protein
MVIYKSKMERAVFMLYQGCHSVVTIPTKRMSSALLLTLIFGPIGMFYSTILGAIIMLALLLTIAISAFGIGLLLIIWLIQLIWTGIAVNSYNKRIMDKIINYNRASLKIRAYNL